MYTVEAKFSSTSLDGKCINHKDHEMKITARFYNAANFEDTENSFLTILNKGVNRQSECFPNRNILLH